MLHSCNNQSFKKENVEFNRSDFLNIRVIFKIYFFDLYNKQNL